MTTTTKPPMTLADLRPLQLVQTRGREILKVSTLYPGYVTAEVVYPVPPRTTVRTYLPEQVATWSKPSPRMLARYDHAWGRA